MAKSTGVGLADLEAAFAEAEASMADDATEPASSVTSAPSKASSSEQPSAVEPEVSENVGLLDILEENLDDEERRNTVDDDSPTHLVNGKYLTTQELINGYMRQEDYTKKTQELASDRDRLRNAETLYNAVQENPYDTLRLLWQKYNMGQPVASAVQGNKPQGSVENIDELVAQKVSELLGSDPRIKEVQSLAAAQAEDAAFAAIEQEYGKTLTAKDRAFIKQKAAELGTDNLQFVFAGLYQQAQLRQARKDQLKMAATAGGRRSDENENTPKKKEYTSFEDAFMDTLAELGWDSN